MVPKTIKNAIDIVGDDVAIASGAVTSLALLLHEFATNAAKYGGCLIRMDISMSFVRIWANSSS